MAGAVGVILLEIESECGKTRTACTRRECEVLLIGVLPVLAKQRGIYTTIHPEELLKQQNYLYNTDIPTF